MSDTILKLRTATFGGFHRQDVVNYIESSTKEHAAQVNALRAELKQAQELLTTLKDEKARADALEVRCETLTQRVEELTPYEAEVLTLREQVSTMEVLRADAEAYVRLKDELSSIELEARSRAAQLLAQAESESEAKRAQAREMLSRVMSEYNRVGGDADSAIGDVICKLTDLRASLSALAQLNWEDML